MSTARIRVQVRPHSQVVAGRILGRGEHEIVVTDAELIKVRELVETNADRELIAEAARRAQPNDEGDLAVQFFKLTGRGLPPITSLEVLS